MFDSDIKTIHDLEDVSPMLKQYGEACLLWRKGHTASFKWFGQTANAMEDLKEKKRRVNEILNPTIKLG